MAAPTLPRRPHWGYQTSLFQFRQPAFWFFLVVLIGAGIYFIIEQGALSNISGSGWVLSWLLLLIYAVPVFLLVYLLDLYEREPVSLLIGAVLWGGIAAVTMAGFANGGWLALVLRLGGPAFAGRWAPALVAPFTEEILKGIGVVLIYLIARREMDDIMDGFVYGALVGLGFTVVEDVFYFVGVFAPRSEFGGPLAAVFQGFYLRVVAGGLYGHVLYTGLVGIGVAYFVSRRYEASMGKRLAVAIGLLLAAMAGHFFWNSPLLERLFPTLPLEGAEFIQLIGYTALKGLPLLGFVALMVVLARRREHRWLGAALAGEVGGEGVLPEEMHTLQTPGGRRAARRAIRARAGGQAAHVLKRLQREQINLAMVRTRVVEDDHPDLVRQRQYCRGLRDWLIAATTPRPAPQA
jgi:protease PrsW